MAISCICSIDGCGKKHEAHGWCAAHYTRWKKYSDPLHGGELRKRLEPVCSIDGCDNPTHARGWCSLHWKRWYKHGDPLRAGPQKPQKPKRDSKHPHSFEEVAALLSYDPETGVATWKQRAVVTPWDKTFNEGHAGERAGSQWSHGYRVITIDDVRYGEHRIAWLLSHGEWPPKLVDHIDGNPSNNKLSNLRLADHFENSWNRGGSGGTSRYRGIWKDGDQWRVVFMVRGKNIKLGKFNCETSAALAYDRAARKHYGEFAKLNLSPSKAA